LSYFQDRLYESCFIEIPCKKKNIVVGEIYRLPNTDEQFFLDKYEEITQKINSENKDIVIGTDKNLDYLKLNEHVNTSRVLRTVAQMAQFHKLNFTFLLISQ